MSRENDTSQIFTDYDLEGVEVSGISEAGLKNNPLVRRISFVFTDNQPNGNGEQIEEDEYQNVIDTGVNMPVKMQVGNPNGKHHLSTPIGAITKLEHVGNKIIGEAALWKKERPEDIEMLEYAYASGDPLKLSWEVLHSSAIDSNGIKKLKGTTVKAITFVGNPAYGGRTNVFAMAEQQSETQEETELTDTNITPDVAALQAQLADLQTRFDALQTENESLKSDTANNVSNLETANSELETLRQYKAEREAAESRAELLRTRRNALVEAGITLSDEEFESRSERFASMDDENFTFYVNDLTAFAKPSTETSASVRNTAIPNLSSTDKPTPYEFLRKELVKK